MCDNKKQQEDQAQWDSLLRKIEEQNSKDIQDLEDRWAYYSLAPSKETLK